MKDTAAQQPSPSPTARQSIWKRPINLKPIGVLWLVSLVGAALVNPVLGSPSHDAAAYIGELFGLSLIPFFFGSLISAFNKGPAKIVLGSITIAFIYGFLSIPHLLEKWAQTAEKSTLNSIQTELQNTKREAYAQLESTGDIDIAPARLAQSFSNVLSHTTLLPKDESNALAGFFAVMTPFLDRRREIDAVYDKISNPSLLDPANWSAPEDLDEPITFCTQFEALYQKQLETAEQLDLLVKNEFRLRGIEPSKVQQFVDAAFTPENKQGTIGLIQCNLTSAEVTLRQLRLLKDNWGAWTLRGGTPVFSKQTLNDEWAQSVRDYFQALQTKEALARKWATSK